MSNHDLCNCQSSSNDNSIDDRFNRLGNEVQVIAENLVKVLKAQDGQSERSANMRSLGAELERILGGEPVQSGDFPECCLIGDPDALPPQSRWWCTGTLIHPRVVVTAEHCIFSARGRLSPDAVAIGVDDIEDITSEAIYEIERIEVHPHLDIALLILHDEAHIQPIARATQSEVAGADRIELAGFGSSDRFGSSGFGIKRHVNVEMNVVRQTPDQDLRFEERRLGFKSNFEFVAGRVGSGKDSCKGDSGGPAYVIVEGERKLAGATSRATRKARPGHICGDGGIYVRVDTIADWIEATIASI